MTKAAELKDSLQGHAARLSAIAGDHAESQARERALAELRKVETSELATLIAFKTEYEGTFTQLLAINWPMLAAAVNIGGAQVELKAIVSDLGEGIKLHQDVLATFADDREPTDVVLRRVTAIPGPCGQASRAAGGVARRSFQVVVRISN